MRATRQHQDGFHLIFVLIVIAVLSVVGFTAFAVMKKDKQLPSVTKTTQPSAKDTTKSAAFVRWQFNDVEWKPMGSAPACDEPLTIVAPIDLTKATTQLYPGQMRGGDFKPHGGL